MWAHLKRDKYFIICISFLLLLIIVSIGNSIFFDGKIRQTSILYDESGNVHAAPFPPSFTFLLGTDMKGYDLLHRVVDGAKWTIGISLLIAFLRTFIGLAIGLFFAFYVRKSFKTLEALFDCFTVVPMTLIGYFILDTVLRFQNGSPVPSFFERASFEIVVLVILALPVLIFYFAKETKKILNEEFIEAATILGGSKFHLAIKHIFPNIFPILIIVMMQQFVQTLIIFSHFGILELFFGGTILFYGNEAESVSNEWSGLIGLYFRSLSVQPWIPMVPITFFILTIITAHIMLQRIQLAFEKRHMKQTSQEPIEQLNTSNFTQQFPANSFTLYDDK